MRNTLALLLFGLGITACGVDEDRDVDASATPLPEALIGLECDDPGWGWNAPLQEGEVGTALDYGIGCDTDPWGDGGGGFGGGGFGGGPGGGGDDANVCTDVTKVATRSGSGTSQTDAMVKAEWWAREAAFQLCTGDSYTPWTRPWPTCSGTTSDDQGVTLGDCTVTRNPGYDDYWSCTATGRRLCHYSAR